jgi:hypothetical protein
MIPSPGLTREQDARWRDLLPPLTNELPDPSRVEIILTDRYEQVAGEYAVQAVDKMNDQMTAEQYSAVKIDGSVAAARTIELPDKVVVVVAAPVLDLRRRCPVIPSCTRPSTCE